MVGVRAVGTPILSAASISVGANDYATLRSPWQTVDQGSCSGSNPLLAGTSLYKLQTKSDSADALAIVNAEIELRWQAE
jgi:hypothetical protein